MKEYVILKTSGIPDWNAVPSLSVDTVLWEPDCGIRMTQQLCYDETALYVRQQARESAVRAEYSAPFSPVHEDSCMEFFFALGADERYFNFEINPNGCIELGFGPNRKNRVRLCHKAEQETFRPCCVCTADGWTAEYCLPLDFLRLFYPDFRLVPGVRFRGNCYKCGDRTEHLHFLAWNPINTHSPDFHRPEFFGKLILS